MSLSLFDLSDYPGNQWSYWKGKILGLEGEKQSDKNPGLEPQILFLEASKSVLEPSHWSLNI